MKLIFIRHAQPAWVVNDAGRDDPVLTELGERQARALASRLIDAEIDAVWVSPARRSQQTAAPVLEARAQSGQTLPFLEELRSAPIAGMTPDEIGSRFRGARTRSYDDWWHGIDGGESSQDFVRRIGNGIDQTFAEQGIRWEDRTDHRVFFDVPRAHNVAVICHAGTTAAAVSHLLALPQVPWAWERFRLGHTGMAVLGSVALSDGVVFGMHTFNDLGHLEEEMRTQ